MLNTAANQLTHLYGVISGGAGDITSTCGFSQFADVEVLLHVAVGRGGGDTVDRGGSGILAAGLAIVVIVCNNGRQVNVAACAVDQMVSADGGSVTVTHGDQNVQVGICQSNAGGSGQSAAMSYVHAIDIQIVIHTAEAADSTDQADVMLIQLHLCENGRDGLQHDTVTTAGTPRMREFVKEHIILISNHLYISSNFSRICCGVIRMPSVRFA